MSRKPLIAMESRNSPVEIQQREPQNISEQVSESNRGSKEQQEGLVRGLNTDLPPDHLSDEGLHKLGQSHYNQFRRSNEMSDIEKAIEYGTHACDLTPEEHPGLSDRLTCLGAYHDTRFRQLGKAEDAEKSIGYLARSLALTPDSHPDFSFRLANLGISYNLRYQHLGKLEDLDKSIAYRSRALALTPDDHPHLLSRLAQLGASHSYRYRRLGKLDDLEKACEYRAHAVKLTPDGDPNLSQRLAELGTSSTDRYQRLGEFGDLEKALEYRSRALELTPNGHPDRPERFAHIGVSYGHRYQRLNEISDLEKSIEYRTRALELTPDGHPELPRRLANLAVPYGDRYHRFDQVDDLEKMTEYFSRALKLTPKGHPDLRRWLAGLGASYTTRYQRLDVLGDVDSAIEYQSQALELTPVGHPELPYLLSDIGVSYTYRYRRMGGIEDLKKAIEHRIGALKITPNGHPDQPRLLAFLGESYTDRYRRLGDLDDLERSIEHKSQALHLTPGDHPSLPDRLADLGVSYSDRYRRLAKLKDLEKSIEYISRALELTPDGHPNLSLRNNSLGVSYEHRYRLMGEPDDLEKSIKLRSHALTLAPDGHPDLPYWLTGLGSSYFDRYLRMGALNDLKMAMDYGSRALFLTPDGHPDLSLRHFSWALSCFYQYQHTGDPTHLNNSLDSFRKASQLLTGPPRDVFDFAFRWAKLASEHDSLSCIEAFRVTVELLPHFIWLGSTTSQRYQDLTLAENVAVRAASAAILSSEYRLALEWLEHARCIVWNQSLMLRSPVHNLKLSHPELGTRLQTVAKQLHDAGSEPVSSHRVSSGSIAPEERHDLANEYSNLLAEVRQLPGFEDFLRPTKVDNLMHAARHGPVVVIVCHEGLCNALLILPEQEHISHLHLPNFTEEKAQRARSEIESSLRRKGLQERGVKVLPLQEPSEDIPSVLATIWDGIIKPILDHLGYLNDDPNKDLPHITWCPTGAISFLLLHAAGDYEQPRSRVFDYVISSYTPTLTALLASVPSMLSRESRVLAIGQEATPGHTYLPGTTKELACVKAHVENIAEYAQLIEDEATTAVVLDAMEEHDWVHLACHAHQNVVNPTKSGFYLHDGTLDLTAINQRSFKNKGLAFLSACQTATGDEKLPDEAIHLASGMLMAGYPSVIGTLWSVIDDDAPFITDKVYAELMKDGKVGSGEAGRALHYAVAALREKVGEQEFGRWVPYIHIGS
ncbi:unnamed protein product [Rhizoctonia solani]|uniref:CHAT domain-containing protein n=1 Tax=Rhizoctonia solani TaxID=456999 RepID=A0A8H2W6C1_9AGAM|nr:unnamed protein product [Rhizoctonia solani]